MSSSATGSQRVTLRLRGELPSSHELTWWLCLGLTLLIVMVTGLTFTPRVDLVRNPLVIVTFLTILVLAEQMRVQRPGRIHTAPLASSLGLAIAFASGVPGQGLGVFAVQALDYSAAVCVVVVAVGSALGAVPRWRNHVAGGDADVLDLVIRLFTVALCALVWRHMSFGGHTLAAPPTDRPGWHTALLMVSVGTVAVLLESPLRSAPRAVDEHLRWFQAIRDEARAALGLAGAVAITATLIAVCLPVLGLTAMPLMTIPLALTQLALRRHATIRQTYRQTITALSRMPEVVGLVPRGHSRAVADLSMAVGRRLGMNEREVNELEYAALLHDVGQVTLRYPIPGGATVQAAPVDQQRIADDGAHIVRETGVLDGVAEILANQSAPYRRVVESQEELSTSSRILKVVNAYQDFYASRVAAGGSPEDSRASALERIYLGLGYEYDPAVVDALETALDRLA